MLKMMMMMLLMMLISVLQIFEWWYFRKYGTSFIEQVSVSHLRPLLGGVDNSTPNSSSSSSSSGDTESSRQSVSGQNLGRTPAILALNGSGHDSDLGPWNLEPWFRVSVYTNCRQPALLAEAITLTPPTSVWLADSASVAQIVKRVLYSFDSIDPGSNPPFAGFIFNERLKINYGVGLERALLNQ